MVEEVNYDLLPFWISHEAIADDEHKRDVGEGEERGISGNNHGQCLFRSFNIFCSCSSVRFFNALLDLFCPPLILDINKRQEKACWMLYRNLNTNVFQTIWYIKHNFLSLLKIRTKIIYILTKYERIILWFMPIISKILLHWKSSSKDTFNQLLCYYIHYKFVFHSTRWGKLYVLLHFLPQDIVEEGLKCL